VSKPGNSTYLAVNQSGNVRTHEVQDDCCKRHYPREGVKLSNEQIGPMFESERQTPREAPERTDPYRPPVRATAPNNAPFEVKGCGKLPAEKGRDTRNIEQMETDRKILSTQYISFPTASTRKRCRIGFSGSRKGKKASTHQNPMRLHRDHGNLPSSRSG
jgi:hypothetical protein